MIAAGFDSRAQFVRIIRDKVSLDEIGIGSSKKRAQIGAVGVANQTAAGWNPGHCQFTPGGNQRDSRFSARFDNVGAGRRKTHYVVGFEQVAVGENSLAKLKILTGLAHVLVGWNRFRAADQRCCAVCFTLSLDSFHRYNGVVAGRYRCAGHDFDRLPGNAFRRLLTGRDEPGHRQLDRGI